MTLPELMDFAKWLVEEADTTENHSCNCHPDFYTSTNKVEIETARWWREKGYGNEA